MYQHDHIALEVSGVTKRFVKNDGPRWPWKRNDNDRKPVVAVDRVSFQVRRGEVFGILGPNGSGKSTLVRCIATLLLPDEGCITVFGHDVLREEMAVKQLINRVSVEASFFKKLTPMENLLYGARLYGLGGLPAWMQPLACISPATYVLEGMRAALLNGAGTGALLGYLGRLVLIGLVAIPVGLTVFRRAEKYAKRTGKLKRSG